MLPSDTKEYVYIMPLKVTDFKEPRGKSVLISIIKRIQCLPFVPQAKSKTANYYSFDEVVP